MVIGRNEGARLSACLESVRCAIATVVYVDSRSTDESLARARQAGAIAVPLEQGRLSAARGRQEGLEVLTRDFPDMEFVQFIDADCLLQPGFVEGALEYLEANPRTAAVTGRRREEGKSFYSRLIDIDWDIPAGPVRYVGGDSLWRISAIREAGGWARELIAGEEPDLCFRLRDLGWVCHRLPIEMTLHDIRMKRFMQYWRRSVRAGHAYAEVAWRRRRGHGREWGRQVVSILAYGLVLPVAFIACLIWFWPAAIVIALLYARLMTSIVLRCSKKGNDLGLSLAYALYTTVCKGAAVIGVARYFVGRVTGARSRIIEYHGNAGPAAYAHASVTEARPQP